MNAGNNKDLPPIGERRLKFVDTYHKDHEIIPRGSQKLSKNGRLFDYYRLNLKDDELACGKQGTSIPLWRRNEALRWFPMPFPDGHRKPMHFPTHHSCASVSPDTLKQIPKSTIHDWDKRHDKYTFGREWLYENQPLLKPYLLGKRLEKSEKKRTLVLKVLALNKLFVKNKSAIKNGEQRICCYLYNKISNLKMQIPINKILSCIGISHIAFRNLAKVKCSRTHSQSCPLKHPQQVLKEEVDFIQKQISEFGSKFFSLSSLFYNLKLNGKASYCLNTFYKVCHRNGLTICKLSRRRKYSGSVVADLPLSIIHIDVTKFKLIDNTIAFIYVVKDNFSRRILIAKAFRELRAKHLETIMTDLIDNYFQMQNHFVQIITDGGPENKTLKGYIKRFALTNLEHKIALVDVDYSNSMVEAANKTLKYNGLYLENVANFHSLEKILPIIKEKMNENRMTVLGGLTPNEKYENKTVADVFGKIHFQFTKQDRLKINKEINCCKIIQKL